MAIAAQSPYRRAEALYQHSVLDTQMKQWSKAFDESQESFRQAKLANSAFSMSKAKKAESAALQYLARPKQELEAMQESLAIARSAKSDVAESMALINLADVYLRRNDFKEVLELSQRSLELANALGNTSTAATNKANIGFALLGLGRIEAGKRLAEQAVEEYERAGAVAETGELLVEYGQHLADAGDYKGAIALFDRERKLRDEIAAVQREKTERELRESEKRKREIELLNRERGLQSVELQNRQLQQRIWWLLAAVFAAVVRRRGRAVPQAPDDQPAAGLQEQRTELPEQPRSADRALQPAPFPEFHQRRPGRDGPATRRSRKAGAGAAADRPRSLQADQRPVRPCRRRCGADRRRAAAARHAAGNGHDRALGRRGVPGLRSAGAGGPARRNRRSGSCTRVSEEPIQYMGHYIQVTVSIGYSPVLLPPDDVSLGWERVIGLVDKALYMAKLHGRNRAFGVGGMLRPGDEALAAVDTDLEQAWRDGVVDMRVLLGTRRRSARRWQRRRRER